MCLRIGCFLIFVLLLASSYNLSWPVDLCLYTNPLPVSERPCLNRACFPACSTQHLCCRHLRGTVYAVVLFTPSEGWREGSAVRVQTVPAEDSSSQNLPGSSKPLVTPAPGGANISSSFPRHCTDTHTQFKIKIKPYLSLLKACPLSECSH